MDWHHLLGILPQLSLVTDMRQAGLNTIACAQDEVQVVENSLLCLALGEA